MEFIEKHKALIITTLLMGIFILSLYNINMIAKQKEQSEILMEIPEELMEELTKEDEPEPQPEGHWSIGIEFEGQIRRIWPRSRDRKSRRIIQFEGSSADQLQRTLKNIKKHLAHNETSRSTP